MSVVTEEGRLLAANAIADGGPVQVTVQPEAVAPAIRFAIGHVDVDVLDERGAASSPKPAIDALVLGWGDRKQLAFSCAMPIMAIF